MSDQLITTQQTSSTSSATNVQVVYSASHIDSIGGTSSAPSSGPPQTGGSETFTSTLASSGVAPEVTSVNAASIASGGAIASTVAATIQQPTPMDTDTAATISEIVGAAEYLNPAQTGDGAEMIVGGATTGDVGGAAAGDTTATTNEEDATNDLATQLINQYSSVEDGTAATSEVAAAFEASKPAEAVAIATTTPSQAAPNTTEN